MDLTVREIALIVGGTVEGDGSLRITGLNGLKEAKPGDLSFYADTRYLQLAETAPAAALIVDASYQGNRRPLIRVASPYFAFAQALRYLESLVLIHPKGIHPTAVVAPTAALGREVALDAHVVVADGARIGDRVVLYAGVYVGRDSVIGDDTVLYPHVAIRERVSLGARCVVHANATIGSDGFGFTRFGGVVEKIPQVGTVEIADDVEIGANSSIDRGTTGPTTVGRGTKIDNLVQVAHNVHIGAYCTISSGTGVAGSTTLGNNVVVGGQAGFAGHQTIGDNVMVGGQTGVLGDVAAGKVILGTPHHDVEVTRRVWAALPYLPGLLKRLRKLEKRVEKSQP